MARVVVIGGGLGGCASAARLAKLGHDVTLVERLDHLGGAIGFLEQDGYRWDTGPTSTALPAVIRDPALCYPHSVAFTPETGHLVVTNAGANYFSVYAPTPDGGGRQWSQAPIVQQIVNSEDEFRAVIQALRDEKRSCRTLAIEHAHARAPRQQLLAQMRSGESRAAGDQADALPPML